MPNKLRATENHVISIRPKPEIWQELWIMADSEMRSLPSMVTAIIHKEFMARFPKGLQEYFKLHPEKLAELSVNKQNTTL